VGRVICRVFVTGLQVAYLWEQLVAAMRIYIAATSRYRTEAFDLKTTVISDPRKVEV
jgi:hypothetical protein